MSATLPCAAPSESNAAACVPRLLFRIPARSFLFSFVLFHQRGARRKNCRERQETVRRTPARISWQSIPQRLSPARRTEIALHNRATWSALARKDRKILSFILGTQPRRKWPRPATKPKMRRLLSVLARNTSSEFSCRSTRKQRKRQRRRSSIGLPLPRILFLATKL